MSIYDCYDFYLTAEDLKSGTHVVKIVNALQKDFHNPRTHQAERKIVLVFENRKRKMILNPTQADAIYRITGEDDERKWIGTEIMLSAGKAPNGKQTIRVTDRKLASKNIPVVV